MLSKREYGKLKALKAKAVKKGERTIEFNALKMSITYVNEILRDHKAKQNG